MTANIERKAAEIADQVVPQYRKKGGSYSCSSHTARRWSAAANGAAIALGPTMPAEGRRTAVLDVLDERARQMDVEGWSTENDDAYQAGDLANAAACYSTTDPRMDPDRAAPVDWPWAASWWKPTNRRRDLVKAGALILAEIERLDRADRGGADTDGEIKWDEG